MPLMVCSTERFFRTLNGEVYPHTTYDYRMWQWYLQVFDEVIVLARIKDIAQEKLDKPLASGPRVSFEALPCFVGPRGFVFNYFRLTALVRRAIEHADAFILLGTDFISAIVWRELMKRRIPYGVEVIGDPWDAFSPGSVKSVLRPLIRRLAMRNTRLICWNASAATYVTKYGLQKRYPPGGWSTHFSDVRLPDGAIIEQPEFEKRIERIRSKTKSGGPWNICHIGMMEHLYKAPDVLLKALARCSREGLNVKLTFIGDGRMRGQLENQAARLGIAENVEFAGKLTPGKAIFEKLDESDLFVLPSRQEGLPRALVEAMARGLPCIASTVGGIPELLDSSVLVTVGDAKALAAKIESVLGDTDRLEQMARRNLQKAGEYRAEILNHRRIEFYKKVVEETNARRGKQDGL